MNRNNVRKYNNSFRLRVLKIIAKNDIKCANCGITDVRILDINHINGGGAKETKHNNRQFYYDIIKGRRQTDDLNLLCKNCNFLHYLKLNELRNK
jgi:5-methylcytosine-specific restriction endonuclease McrA